MNTFTQLLPVINIACLIAIYFVHRNIRSNSHKHEELIKQMLEIKYMLNEVKLVSERVNGVVWATHGDIDFLKDIFDYLNDLNEEDDY